MTRGAEPTVAAYGAWRSPLSAEDAAGAATRFGGLRISRDEAGRRIWWAESVPAERGRMTIWCAPDGEAPFEVSDTVWARSKVNEYGGGAFWAEGDRPYWVDERTQRILSSERALTASTLVDATPTRFAGGGLTPDGEWIVCERERHLDQVVNDIVAIPSAVGARADEHVLVAANGPGGGDFTAGPVVAPDGGALAWLRWDHPDMPWDAAELWAASLDRSDGVPRSVEPRRVAGGRVATGRTVSVCLPSWDPDGRLWWCDDASDWWHLRSAPEPGVPAEAAGDGVPLVHPGDPTTLTEEVGEPRWVAGGSRYGFTGDGRVVFAASRDGLDSVWVLDARSGERRPLPGADFDHVEHLVVDGTVVAVVGGSATTPTSVWRVDLDDGSATDLRHAPAPLDPAWISVPEPVTFPTGDGEFAHALFYPPHSADHVAPEGELPPLVVRIHGGPTAAARAELSTSVQFWTTRGFAVADVNYRGSTGFGRRFRDLLRGAWGDADVEDCIAVTRHLAEAGLVDGGRCVIRGGSAGGFTALAAVCFQAQRGHPGAFAAACSLYGVTDLASLASDTHKFESRYLDGLVGELPRDRAVYRQRSPLHHAQQLDRPVLLLQGSADRVVPPSQAEVLVSALRANRVPHAYVLFPGEGHGFSSGDTIARALGVELAFYGQVLGFTPAGDVPELTLD